MDLPRELIRALKAAQRLVVFTGAGVSAESGIPTFRDRQTGLWERFRAEELATPQAFERDPALVWGWYEWRRAKVLRAQPNPAHRAIAEMEERLSNVTLVTQNVDDLHERAGSRDVVHLHGSLMRPYCQRCKQPHRFEDGTSSHFGDEQRVDPPACLSCGGRVRPGVVWFGESLPTGEWERASASAGNCDAFLCVGTSAVVYPAAALVHVARRKGATTVQVNPNATDIDDDVSFSLRGAAGVVLPQLVGAL
jgi:NAD-dependent deacetylase